MLFGKLRCPYLLQEYFNFKMYIPIKINKGNMTSPIGPSAGGPKEYCVGPTAIVLLASLNGWLFAGLYAFIVVGPWNETFCVDVVVVV